MSQKSERLLGEKIDAENFVSTFLEGDKARIAVVMNHVAYEAEELDELINAIGSLSERFNLGLSMKVHPYRHNDYFVMIELEKV